MEWFVSFFLLFGASFAFLGALGLVRMPDFYTRMHPPTKATTLGSMGILVASTIYFTAQTGRLNILEPVIIVFLFLTAPISAHFLSKAALHLGVKPLNQTLIERLPPDSSPELTGKDKAN
ncbi:MAG: Na+/H+ antiporter subunit G [Armatimonadetes bacterium]|nr:Na+/H+ antiporter subunit G [Armatimonadota bacterium]MDW8029136.1 Na+/H+ antiporter subunit G [Armatimonadota bacterium]